MSEHANEPERGGVPARESWVHGVVAGAVMLVVSYLVFVLIPNNLLTYLTLHVNPRTRDLLILVWWVAALVFSCWLFVRLQRGRLR